jgi:hypothetical protein
MTIMVDEVRLWPTTIRCFREGSAHLTTDGPVEELHAFAALLGLQCSVTILLGRRLICSLSDTGTAPIWIAFARRMGVRS